MLMWRSLNLGMKELDIVLGRFSFKYIPNMSEEDCIRYEEQVLDVETPDLYSF